MAKFALALCGLLALSSVALGRDIAPRPLQGQDDICQSCVVAVRILEDFLCDPAATDFLVDFVEKNVCPVMGDSDQCFNLAEGLVPTMVQWFRATATPASLCSATGVCADRLMSNERMNKPALRVRDTAECAMCKFVITEAKIAVNNSGAIEKMKEAALQACTGLPGDLSQSCIEFVDTYESIIVEVFDETQPEDVCSLLGVCVESVLAVKPKPLPAPLVASLATAMKSTLPLHPTHPMMAEDALGGPSNDGCDYCKMAVIEAHSLIANPAVQQEIMNYTKTMCEGFTSVTDVCKLYVDQYAPLVFGIMEQYLVPDTLCVELGMCHSMSFMDQLKAGLLTQNLKQYTSGKFLEIKQVLGWPRIGQQ